MTIITNPWPGKLLSWHGHRGGVRVPFHGNQGPLEDTVGNQTVIETRLVKRLRSLATDLATGVPVPRFIFLVGGPGNGKSEAVQDFLIHLDTELDANGALTRLIKDKFKNGQMLRWCVDITESLAADIPNFSEKIGRLIVIQDASASEQPDRDAAAELADYIVDLFTHPEPLPVFVCCVNRGLLARCLRAVHEANLPQAVLDVVKGIIQVTALGNEALTSNRRACWPLDLPDHPLDGTVACWPLDMESLLLSGYELDSQRSPMDQAIQQAVAPERWQNSVCGRCEINRLCPLFQNALWLQEEDIRRNLMAILRRAELATGQRWNFRDMFSLVAELIVGEAQDFLPEPDPCVWVYQRSMAVQSQGPQGLEGSFQLLSRLYPNALFPVLTTGPLPDNVKEVSETAAALEHRLPCEDVPSTTHIRGLLRDRIAPRMDPALLSPGVPEDPLAVIEYGYSQSLIQGNEAWPSAAPMSNIERAFFELLVASADELDPFSIDYARVTSVQFFLKTVAATYAKRSVGTRLGMHAELTLLVDYEASIRHAGKLFSLTKSIKQLLGDGVRFQFNALESFGQPQDHSNWLVSLQGTSPNLSITRAPDPTPELPAHDLPFISVGGHAVALTFDLYKALRLRKEGFSNSSLPASVRAAIDRIRHLIAGKGCRDKDAFLSQTAELAINGHGSIVLLPHESERPTFQTREED